MNVKPLLFVLKTANGKRKNWQEKMIMWSYLAFAVKVIHNLSYYTLY